PIPGVQLRIVEEKGAEAQTEGVGEVYAHGDNVMLGYWNDKKGTKERLRNGWLRTGDLGRIDNDGFLFLKGRSTDMIKTGANRVSPDEIEEVVNRFEEIKECAAYGIRDELLGEAIAISLVREKRSTVSVNEIKRRCLRKLPQYKIPKVVRFVTNLPKTSSGKVQRYRLAKSYEEEKRFENK
ncbi:MAG: hypothetical protein DRR42_22075, partial [Gammaproteobacteria bacterium]